MRAFLHDWLKQPEVSLVITPMVVQEFLHLVTDSRRFDGPLSMGEALAVSRVYLQRSNVECVAVDEESCVLMQGMLVRHGLGRNRVADPLLAATLLTHGVRDLITCNPDDFGLFQELHLIDPTERGP